VQELAEESAAEGGLVKCSRFLFNDFFQTMQNLNFHWTHWSDLHRIAGLAELWL